MKKITFLAALFVAAIPQSLFGMFLFRPAAQAVKTRAAVPALRTLATEADAITKEKERKKIQTLISREVSKYRKIVAEKGDTEATALARELTKDPLMRQHIANEALQRRAKKLIARSKEVDAQSARLVERAQELDNIFELLEQHGLEKK